MSSFASNLVSVARSKLRSSYGGGSRDNLSLHRWVLLKNSITQDVSSDSNTSSAALFSDATDPDVDAEFEDEEVDSIIDEGMFAFLFPDPGDAAGPSNEGSVSEAQWLDSILETLGDSDDEGSDVDMRVAVNMASDECDSEQHVSRVNSILSNMSFSGDFAAPTPIAVPYPVPYPPFHPPLVHSFDFDADVYFCSSRSDPYSPYRSGDIDDPEGSVPDAIDDTSDDESDAPSTPFSRSRTSLNLSDPASIPLPRDRHEPHIYSASDKFFSYEGDPLPYSDLNSESTASVYSPYHQNC
ncbi:hypothetical protein M0805_009295 [Coniferiporia weirii]|nr:hypothetical protein M0805_009295 [Coniferiporia weirii]